MAAEIAQQLEVLTALVEEQGLTPNTHSLLTEQGILICPAATPTRSHAHRSSHAHHSSHARPSTQALPLLTTAVLPFQ